MQQCAIFIGAFIAFLLVAIKNELYLLATNARKTNKSISVVIANAMVRGLDILYFIALKVVYSISASREFFKEELQSKPNNFFMSFAYTKWF